MDIFLYAVIRDVPSLLSKVKRLVAVWIERHVINDFQAREAERTIDAALDDYHHNTDRRYQSEPLQRDQDSFSDHGSFDPSFDPCYDEVLPEANSVDSAEDYAPREQEESVDEDSGDEQRLRLIERIIQAGSAAEDEEQAVRVCERKIEVLPSWVISVPDFQSRLSFLEEDTDQTSDILYRAMEPVMDLESHLNAVIEKRSALRSILDSVHDWKRKRTEVLLKTIEVRLRGSAEE